MKLTSVQRLKVEQAYNNVEQVLREIKRKKLGKGSRNDMKMLETAVLNLEV